MQWWIIAISAPPFILLQITENDPIDCNAAENNQEKCDQKEPLLNINAIIYTFPHQELKAII